MDHEKRGSGMTVIGVVIAAAVIIGLAVVTSAPFQDKFAKKEVAQDTASEAAKPAVAENEAPSSEKPAATADSESAAAEDAASSQPPDEEAAPEKEAAADAGAACCKKGDQTPPLELVAQVPPGGLHNPYDWKELVKEDPNLVKQFRLPGCNECHGGGGGGGFCPALSQGVWFWGNTDDVLFRLITEGSAVIENQGFVRYQYGTVHAPMPPMGHTIKTADHLWHIISFIRSINPPGTNPPEKVIPGKFVPPAGGDNKAE
jgi:mono/diheme cytochrome c family protein/Tfp pilus assembly major pilin PilA